MVRRVPIVLRLLSHGVIAGRYQGAVPDQHVVLAEAVPRRERELRSEVVDDPVRRRLRHPDQRRQLPQRQVGAPVRGHQQHPVLKRELPGPATSRRVDALAA